LKELKERKHPLVAGSCEPRISLSKLALENNINANLLFKWRQQWRERKRLLSSTEFPQLLPCDIRCHPFAAWRAIRKPC
jgi:transposase